MKLSDRKIKIQYVDKDGKSVGAPHLPALLDPGLDCGCLAYCVCHVFKEAFEVTSYSLVPEAQLVDPHCVIKDDDSE